MAARRLRRGLLLVFALLVLSAATGTLVPRPLWPVKQPDDTGERVHRILVLSNPIHTDIAIAVDAETRARFSFLAESGMPLFHPDARWLIFGWGGKAFYLQTPTWADLKPMPLLRGLSLDRSVMHADVIGEIGEAGDGIRGFDISAEGYQRLLAFIASSFVAAESGIVAIPDAGYGPNDRFFDANGWFNAFVGCNTWTAHALREAGLRTGWWNPLPVSLAASLKLYD